MNKERYDKQPLFNQVVFLTESDLEFVLGSCSLGLSYSDEAKTKLQWVDVNSRLALCNGNKIIDLYLESYNSDARQDSINKLSKLIMTIEQLKAALIYADEQAVSLEAECEKNNKTDEQVISDPISNN